MSGENPKDEQGRKKPDLSLVPPSSIIHEATAFMDGAQRYGPYNWRNTRVLARVYIGAIIRHFEAYLDGEDYDPKSRVHHLAYVKANCSILLDAAELEILVDDRPPKGNAGDLIRRFMTQGNLLPERGHQSVQEPADKIELLEKALAEQVMVRTISSSFCKLCDTGMLRKQGDEKLPEHKHQEKCLLYKEGA